MVLRDRLPAVCLAIFMCLMCLTSFTSVMAGPPPKTPTALQKLAMATKVVPTDKVVIGADGKGYRLDSQGMPIFEAPHEDFYKAVKADMAREKEERGGTPNPKVIVSPLSPIQEAIVRQVTKVRQARIKAGKPPKITGQRKKAAKGPHKGKAPKAAKPGKQGKVAKAGKVGKASKTAGVHQAKATKANKAPKTAGLQQKPAKALKQKAAKSLTSKAPKNLQHKPAKAAKGAQTAKAAKPQKTGLQSNVAKPGKPAKVQKAKVAKATKTQKAKAAKPGKGPRFQAFGYSLLEVAQTWKQLAAAETEADIYLTADPTLVKPTIEEGTIGLPEPVAPALPATPCPKPAVLLEVETEVDTEMEDDGTDEGASDSEGSAEGGDASEGSSDDASEGNADASSEGEGEGEGEGASEETITADSDPSVIFSRRRHVKAPKPEPDRGLAPEDHADAKHFIDLDAVAHDGQWDTTNNIENVGGINQGFHNPKVEAQTWAYWTK